MRTISLWLLSLSAFCCSGVYNVICKFRIGWIVFLAASAYSASSSAAYTYYVWVMPHFSKVGADPGSLCAQLSGLSGSWVYVTANKTQAQCTGTDGAPVSTTNMSREGSMCQANKVWNEAQGTCLCSTGTAWSATTSTCESNNPCTAKANQSTVWKREYDSLADHDQNPVRCTSSQGGCAVDICSDVGTKECGTSGSTGKFVCFGRGTYSGEQLEPVEGGGVADCAEPCQPPKPSTTDTSNSCTTPAVANGVTSYSCVSSSNSDQFASSNCAVGEVNGVQALHCTKPDYVPESDSRVKESDVTETTDANGGKATVTDTKTTNTHCKSGVCVTGITEEKTTSTQDADGKNTGETTQCTGDKCDNPNTPEDESLEEEKEEEGVEREVSGDACSSELACAGDAIDCAILRKQKEQNCAMDWNTNKSAVLAEAGKAEYQLEKTDINAADLFAGASAGRWLSPTCPADRVLHLASTGSSITFSWSFVCQYAEGLGNLLVALASLFFAVYVGRAFGGD